LVRHRGRLLGIVGIVADRQLELLTVDASGGVDLVDRHLRTTLELLAERCVLAGHRPCRADLDLRERRSRRQGDGCDSERAVKPFHMRSPSLNPTTGGVSCKLSAAAPSPASLCADRATD